ncbi:MAG: bifunctional (p)ppGpp synthetase/guanosine-3',5'-bis(diphosphate) 3'-pyrophosphohydrolase [Acidobacteria bacterium]|nr:bifunctional (p)ppGpp synthetase/guanosine-3',5'-bis(diphosphate) 3'-pyrophosphohydrolase [Acidobacteriota bacterium]
MVSFENLLGSVRSYNPDTDADLLHRAYEFSALEHAGQIRRSGEQYITHPLEVAHLVAEMHLDDVTIAASLLHDVVEDTLTTIENVRGVFGPEIAHVVEGVTKISTIPFSSSEERQAENFRKMLLAMVDDVRVILVKLADRLHNMRTLDHLREERRLKISQETIDIYAPIAHRLGMNKVKNELEELAFRHLDPPGYESLLERVEARRRATERTVDSLKSTLAAKLRDAGVPIVALEGRIKSIFSIWKKIRRQKISLDEVYDLLAVRVITQSERDCYAALGIIHQTWAPVHGRFKDFVAMPRPNGYQSLHTAVISDLGLPFEVQIRSEDMHRIAEHGIAAHWKYKEGRVGAEPDEKYFLWLRQLLEWQQEVPDPSEFIHSLKLDLYPEEVYTFTPKGEVKALPRGATPIDFAYAIHTDVGHTCVGARVNGRMVPLRTLLQSGDIVEVVTRAGNRPNRDWLNVVATTRARNKIKHFIHVEEKLRAVELGRKLIEKEVRRFDLKPRTVLDPDAVGRVCAALGASKPDDLYASVGYGKVSSRAVLDALIPREQREHPKADASISSAVRRVLRPNQETIKVRGFDDLMVFRAGCCNPIRGEKIVGYVTRGKGVSVHAASCPNVVNLFYDPERRIDVAWDKANDESTFTVCLTIQVEDRRGMIADVTSRLADRRINILKVEASANKDRHGHISVTFDISDMQHLQRVIKVVRAVAGVLDVERVHRKP